MPSVRFETLEWNTMVTYSAKELGSTTNATDRGAAMKSRGETAADVRRKLAKWISAKLEREKELDVKECTANYALETGYSKEFVRDIFSLMEEAGRIVVKNGIAKYSPIFLNDKKKQIEEETAKILQAEAAEVIEVAE